MGRTEGYPRIRFGSGPRPIESHAVSWFFRLADSCLAVPESDICQDSTRSGQFCGNGRIEDAVSAADRERDIAQLYADHFHEILAYCIRRVGVDDAEDLASEVFAIAWRRRDELHTDTSRAWLYGVARGVVANSWRSVFRRRRLIERLSALPDLSANVSEEYFARSHASNEAIACLRRLRGFDQEVLMLAAWEDLTAPEIAAVLGISVAAAEQRLHRARKRFARVMRATLKGSQISSRAAAEEGGR
jgi:RNA polymerase sigma-70 factor, ECF subfamily